MKTLEFYSKLLCLILWTFCASGVWLIIVFFRRNDINNFSHTVNFLGKGLLKIAGLRLELQGGENLSSHAPCILVGNHQTALDVAIYGAICPKAVVAIGKKEIAKIPLFGWLFKLTGGVLLDRKNRERAISQLDEAVVAIRDKKLSMGILPEGTRNREGKGLLPFKKGAFHLAIAAQVPVVPIIISELSQIANFDNKLLRSGRITVRVLAPILTTGMQDVDVEKLSALTREQMLRTLDEIHSDCD